MLIGSAVIIAAFIVWEKRLAQPLIEIGFFRNTHFSAGVIALIIMGLGLNGVNYVLTYYMQFVQGYSALGTGLRYLPLAIGLLVGALNTEKAEKRFGVKAVLAVGFFGSGGLAFLTSQFNVDTSFVQIGSVFFFFGLFLGFVMTAVTDSIMVAIPKAQAGIGSAMNSVFRMLSGTVGVVVLGSIVGAIYSGNFLKAAESIPGLAAGLAEQASESIGAALGAAGSGLLPSDIAGAVVRSASQSFMDGWEVMAIVSGALFIFGAVLVLMLIPSADSGKG
jgi:Na+/melibiose symporter-like transporter